jgi:exopolyphosphatase/guanosine-5'-triphosphate,3'-diphosphate pyrophosphatase
VRADSLRGLRQQLRGTSAKERRRGPGLDAARADIIVAGAVILDVILQGLGARELVLCEWALREGVLLDGLPAAPGPRAGVDPDVRRASVLSLARRCGQEEAHGQRVARRALTLFDMGRRQHRLGAAERSLLEYAALLHDVGRHIAYAGYHKHSEYVIRHGELRGFPPLEIEVLASVARYHRGHVPSRRHRAFARLPRPWRRVVRALAGMLRVADALDHDHRAGAPAATRARHAIVRSGWDPGDAMEEPK